MVRDLGEHLLQLGGGFELDPIRLVLRDEAGGSEMIQRAERDRIEVVRILVGERCPRAIEDYQPGNVIARGVVGEITIEGFEIRPLARRGGRTGESSPNLLRPSFRSASVGASGQSG